MRDEYLKLDKRVQQWIFKQGWTGLREIQSLAISPILSEKTDVLISASTAAGKTEAFFLPACSVIADQEEGVGILYISPLKALINDQDRRLESLADLLNMQITPWHGDSLKSRKNKLRKKPSGIILITPESLESLLIKDSGWVKLAFKNLKYIVIDEFHAFLGSERGYHLLSLLNRLEHLLGRLTVPIPRVALSATLGELDKVPLLLRPNKSLPCNIIKGTKSSATLKIHLKCYIQPSVINESSKSLNADFQVCKDLYKFCRNSNHLIFANSRNRTENIAAQLRDFCDEEVVPNEFFPHHGSLSKDLREALEERLQKDQLPTTAVCTMTLELGIDIGKVNSVIQVTAPHSVSSLRQRMGRSGRRGGPAILRMLITENEITQSSNISDLLRLELIQSLAMVRLLIGSKWFEPSDTSLYHFSTLLHQILATIAQWGGIRAEQLYSLLCKEGPFQKISPSIFMSLLTTMGKSDLITQLNSNELTLGLQGEKVTNHYSFYAVFKTPQEYRIISGNKTLGTIPIDSLILEGQHIVFGGKRWKVEYVEIEKKTIGVIYAKGGKPPKFSGHGLSLHHIVRQEMYKILCNKDYRIVVGENKVDFADHITKKLFQESVDNFNSFNLDKDSIIEKGGNSFIFTWLGDKANNTLVALLSQMNLQVSSYAGVIEIENISLSETKLCLKELSQSALPTEKELADLVPDKNIEKFDEYLPSELLSIGFGAKTFDMVGVKKWLQGNFE